MLTGIVTTDVTAAGANGAAGPHVIAPAIDRLAGKEGGDDLSENLARTRSGDGHDGGGGDDRPREIVTLGVGPDGLPLTGARLLRWVMADPVAREVLRFRVEETDEPLSKIALSYGFNANTMSYRIRAEGWTRRNPDAPKAPAALGIAGERRFASSLADAGLVAARLVRAIDRQVGKVDARLRSRKSRIEEKDSRILGHLARTLATLMALDRDDGATAKEPERIDRDAIRESLKKRLLAWAGEGERSE